MTNISKFHYLKTSVTGNVALLINRFQISFESYNDAWKMLLTEYDDKRALIHTHLQSFICFPFEGKIRNRQRIKETVRHRIRRARSVVESGMPSQLLGPYLGIYYCRETWLKNTSRIESKTRQY
jgi:hypothetical protein